MSFEIRRIEPNDIDGLFDLFNKRKSKELLNWVYGHPAEEGKSAFVAVDEEGKIIGAVGYVKSTYYLNGKGIKGLIPLSWEVDKSSRGLVGMRLIMRVLKDADFYMGMDGSEDMKNIFNGMNFKKIGEGVSARKVLRPFGYLKTLKKIGVRDLLRYGQDLKDYLLSTNKSDIELLPVSKEDFETFTKLENLLYNEISWDHINWLAQNPGMNIHTFKVNINNRVYGPIVCFTKEVKDGKKRGQIVHIPPFHSNDVKYYKDVIIALQNFLFQEKATAITTFTVEEELKRAFQSLNYRFDKKTRPIVVKSNKTTLGELLNTKIHLSFGESDKSVRNI